MSLSARRPLSAAAVPPAAAAGAEAEVERLRQACRQQPRDPRPKTALGDALAAAGRDKQAEKAYREALKLDGRPLETKVKLAGTQLRQGRRGEAARLLLKLVGGTEPAALEKVADILAELLVAAWLPGGDDAVLNGLKALQDQAKAPDILVKVAERLTRHGLPGGGAEACNLALDRWPESAHAFARLAAIMLSAGDAANAALAAAKAIELDISRMDARLSLAHARIAQSDYAGAEAALQEAMLLDVDDAEVLGTYANLLYGLGRNAESLALLERAVSRHPELVGLHRLRGLVLVKLGREDDALASVRRATELAPKDPAQAVAHADVLLQLDRMAEAEAELARALAVAPAHAPALTMQGRLHIDRHELDAAEAALEKARASDPRYSHAWNNLGILKNRRGDYAGALEAFEQAGQLGPLSPATLYNKAYALLGLGHLESGWDHYEMGVHARVRSAWRRTARPLWEGEDLSGKRLGLLAEQGVGDQLFYISCLPDLLAEAGPSAQVAFEVHPKILPLVARSFPQVACRPAERADESQGIEAFDADLDYALQLGSLPARYRRSLESFPDRVGFVQADPLRVGHWRERLATLGPKPKVGLCWRSMLLLTRRMSGYLSLGDLGPLLDSEAVTFVSLQYGIAEEELAAMAGPLKGRLVSLDAEIDLTDELDEVAALMSALDAVVTPSTTVANLAGALGCRTYRFTSLEGSWIRLGTERLPWYPRMEIFVAPPGTPLVETLPQIRAGLERDLA
jgi:Flp pilus assembly protein TadD